MSDYCNNFKVQVDKEIYMGNLQHYVKGKSRTSNAITSLVNHINVIFSMVHKVYNLEWKYTERQKQMMINSFNNTFRFDYNNYINTKTWEDAPIDMDI